MSPWTVETVAQLAKRANIDEVTTAALLELTRAVLASDALRAETATALEVLDTRPSAEGVVWLASREAGPLAALLDGRERLWHALFALLQIPGGDARHRARGIPEDISTETWRDLSIWCNHFRTKRGFLGISLEMFEWTQHYLRGEVIRTGALEWELHPFGRAVHAFRHLDTGETRYLAEPGARFRFGGRREAGPSEPDVQVAAGELGGLASVGHPIDTERGAVLFDRTERLESAQWREVLNPSTPMMEMHIPEGAGLSLVDFAESARRASLLFRKVSPEIFPAGVFGDAWLMDPQVLELLPHRQDLVMLQGACALFPGKIPEARTIHRLFGPEATRASVVAAPREGMNSLQRAVAQLLSDPNRNLLASGGVLLTDRLDALHAFAAEQSK